MPSRLLLCIKIIALVQLVYAEVWVQENDLTSDNDTCSTKECRNFARSIVRGMDTTVNPCEDFYQYMCGNWSKQNPIPPDELNWSVHLKLATKIKRRIRDILQQEKHPEDSQPLRLARKWYRSCMRQCIRDARGIRPIWDILQANGGWPIITNDWVETNTWQNIHNTYQRLYFSNAFYNMDLQLDYQNSSESVIVINHAIGYPLFSSFAAGGDGADLILRYATAMSDILLEFINLKGEKVSQEQATQDVYENIFLLMALQLRGIENPNSTDQYERMTVRELQEFYDNGEPITTTAHINWLDTMKNVFLEVAEQINPDTIVEVQDKHGLHFVKTLLTQTSHRTLVNYIHWNLVVELLPYTTSNMTKLLFDLGNANFSIEQPPRWKTCVDELELSDAVSYAYIQKYGENSSIEKVASMLTQIQLGLDWSIFTSKNLNNIGREFAQRKLRNVLPLIGYPDRYNTTNTTVITQFYEKLTIGTDYFENVLNYLKFTRENQVAVFGQLVNKFRWFNSPTEVNAFYYPQANSIVIPFASFQDAFTEPLLPLPINYARVGFVLGHELIHSFIGQGSGYDQYGNMLLQSINIGNALYSRNMTCIVNKFNQYALHESSATGETIYLDGSLTKLENMADALGILAAHKAYEEQKKKMNKPITKLAGLQRYSDEQLFFMAFASDWCSAWRPEFQVQSANIDTHSPSKYRIIGALSNTKAFGRAFNCPVDSPMNPATKCHLL